jgi:predicted aspartyl protease
MLTLANPHIEQLMKTRLSIFMFFMLIVSCKTVQQYGSQEIKTKIACADIVFEEKIPLLALQIEDVKTKFIFDTGATGSFLTDTIVVAGFSGKKFANFGSARTASGEKIKKRTLQVLLQSELFESNNKVLTEITMPKNKCSKAVKTFSGILGLDVFFEEKSCVEMDFYNNKVCNITGDQVQIKIKKENYYEVKSAFKYKQLFVFLTVQGKEYKFLLDTGFIGNIIFPYDKLSNFQSDDKQELEGYMHISASSIPISKEILYEKMPVRFGKELLSAKINVSSAIVSQNIGIEFMKGFNWIVDYSNSKIYIKRNSNSIESEFKKKISYSVIAESEKLRIAIKEKSQTKYQLGDQIISVNGKKVTPENNCEMQDFLNKTEDWNTLDLEVIPQSK